MKIFFFVFLCLSNTVFSFEKEVCVTAIFQNEARFIKEWIDHHLEIGVKQFLLYNNNSTDNFLDVLNPYIENQQVILFDWPSIQKENDWHHYSFTVQTDAYNHAIMHIKPLYKWLAIIDIDEFIMIKESKLIDTLEKYYSHVSGLNVNWICYGTSNIWECKSLVKEMLYRLPIDHPRNHYCKSIVQPLHVSYCGNPHYCEFEIPYYGVDTIGRKCLGHSQTVEIDKIWINHYWPKDEKFLNEVKIPRYIKWGGDEIDIRNEADAMNEILSNSRSG